MTSNLAIVNGLKQCGFQIYKVPLLTDDILKRARHDHQSYLPYVEEKKRIVSENHAKQAAEAEQSAKEKALLASITKEKRDIVTLEAGLENAEKAYAEATKNSDSVQKTLKGLIGNDPTGVAVQELMMSLEKLRTKETDKRNKVDRNCEKIQEKEV